MYSVTVIGSGNAAAVFAKALFKAGHRIDTVIARNPEHAKHLTDSVKAELKAADTNAYRDIKSDITLLCVSDNAIESVAAELKYYKGIACHCSGTADIAVLKALAHYGVVYPLQSLSKQQGTDLSKVPLLYEASDSGTEQIIKTLVLSISNTDVYADSATRLKYHLAAVWANNFSNLMAGISHHIAEAYKLDFKLLRPLLLETANKLQHMTPLEAQTGPAKRGDEATMSKHLQLLANEPELQQLYKILSEMISKKIY